VLLGAGLGLLCLTTGLALANVGTATEAASTLDTTPAGPSGGWRIDAAHQAGPTEIEGYAGAASVAPGDTLSLYVHSSGPYRIDVYRIGWYDGAGGSLLGCIPACDGSEAAQPQPDATLDPDALEVRAPWHRTDALPIGPDWASGYYQANLVLADGRQYAIPFVVRGSSSAPAPLLVVVPVNTWQAYNEWGGKDLYSSPTSATRVTFDRPYKPEDGQLPWRLEYPLVRFLEANGFSADYVTDVDFDADPTRLTHYHAVVFAGHSEYWTLRMRAGVENALGQGVDVAIMGGNTLYWQIRYGDDSRRELVEYRSASADPDPQPRTKTVRWRDAPLNAPECSVVGEEWQGGGSESEASNRHDYTVATTTNPWFRGSGFTVGARVRGLVDYEWDAVQPSCPRQRHGLTVLFHYEGQSTPQPQGVYTSTFLTQDADAVTFRTGSGARLFNAGTNYFAWGLAPTGPNLVDRAHPPDPRLIRFVRNMLADMAAR
jgi:hypothetical protein